MSDIVRGDLLTVRASPKDVDGAPVTPSEVVLYLNYKHDDGTTSTDDPLTMTLDGDAYVVDWDSKVARPGVLFGSVRAVDPPAAYDFKKKILANSANPDPEDAP